MEEIRRPIDPTELLAASIDEIDAIKTASGLTEIQFRTLCVPVIRAYARHVQALPLSPTAYRSARGAWEFGLTASMVAYRVAGTVIFFPSIGAEERRVLEPQCRYMAFLAVLASGVANVANASKLVDGDFEYHPLSAGGTLNEWLTTHPDAQFAWRTGEPALSSQACAAIAAKFIPTGLLEAFDLRAITMLYEAVSPKSAMNGLETTLARVVRQSIERVNEHHVRKASTHFQEPESGPRSSVSDSERIAVDLVAGNTPAEPPKNPLDQPAPANTHLNNAAPGPSESAVAAASSPQPGSHHEDAANTMLRNANKVLVEWFELLRNHANFASLHSHLNVTDEGIEVPITMLGMFGVSGPSIRKLMDESGLVIRRTENARGLILHPGLHSKFFETKA